MWRQKNSTVFAVLLIAITLNFIVTPTYAKNTELEGENYAPSSSSFQKPANVHTKNDTVTVGYFLGGGIQNSFNKESYPAFSGEQPLYTPYYNYHKRESRFDKNLVLLKDLDYSFYNEIDIPGMPDTREEDVLKKYIFSASQCPQGICLTDEFVLITSYSTEDDCMGELMVFDRETGEYMVTLGMDENSHLGGIAFDGDNVWVCNSYENCVERISYDFIELMAYQNTGDVVDARDVVDEFPVKNTPSCITWYGGRLWIATHTLLVNSRMVAYYLDKKTDKLIALSDYKIPQKVQGVTFDDSGNVYLSTSYGRNQSSYLYCYDSVTALATRPKHPRKKVEMPPASEELDVSDNTLYILFESAGEKYYEGTDGKGKSLFPLDKILKIPIRELDVNGSSTSGT